MAKYLEIPEWYPIIPAHTVNSAKVGFKRQTPIQKFPPGSLLFITAEGVYRLTPAPDGTLEARNRQGNISTTATRRLENEIAHQIQEKKTMKEQGLLPDQDDDCATVLA